MQKLSKTRRLNFWQTYPKDKFVCVHEIVPLIVMKMKMMMEKQITKKRHK